MPVELGLWRIDPSLSKIELGGFDREERAGGTFKAADLAASQLIRESF